MRRTSSRPGSRSSSELASFSRNAAIALLGAIAAFSILGLPARGDDAGRLDRLERLEQEIEATRAEARAIEARAVPRGPTRNAFVAWGTGFDLLVLDDQETDPDRRVLHRCGVHGQLHFDFRSFPDKGAPQKDEFFLRRARIRTIGTFWKYDSWVLECDLGRSGFGMRDAYANLAYWQELQLRAGQFREPFQLENQSATLYLDFVERNMMFRTTNVNYDFGAMVHGDLGFLSYKLAIQNGAGLNTLDTNSDKDVNGRLGLTPFRGSGDALETLMLGASAGYGHEDNFVPVFSTEGNDLGGSVASTPIAQFLTFPAGTAPTPPGVRSQIGARFRWGLDGRFELTPITLQAEYTQMRVDGILAPVGGRSSLGARGCYVDLLWMITGEKYPFSQRVVPAHNLDPHEGGYGAWQVAVRWDHLEADGNDARALGAVGATRCNAFVAGVNWYWTPLLKLQLNYDLSFFNRPASNTKRDAEDVFMVRFQIEF